MPRIYCFRDTGSFSPPLEELKNFELDYFDNHVISQPESSQLRNTPCLVAAYTGQRVCGIVKCFRCERTRCVYATKALTSMSKSSLNEVIENRVFSCGAPLLEVGHPLEGKIYTKPLQCGNNIERSFYCSRFADENVCSRCGKKGKTELNEVKRKRLGLLLPVCCRCKSFESMMK